MMQIRFSRPPAAPASRPDLRQALKLGWEKTEAVARAAVHTGRVLVRSHALDHAVEAAEGLSAGHIGLKVGLGVANLGLGAVDVVQGCQAWQQGHRLAAGLNLGGGVANLVSGAVLLTDAACQGSCGGPLERVGAAASGLGALADATEDLTGKQPHWLQGSLKLSGGALLLAGAASGQGALSAAGSLIYLGAMGAQHGPDLADWVRSRDRSS